MKLDYAKWKDTISFEFLDSRGYLTNEAKELMGEHDCYTLDELLATIEGIGKGRFYKNDTNRSDVGTSGHYSDSLSGKFSIDEDDSHDPREPNKGQKVHMSEYSVYDDMYRVNGKWIKGRTVK